MYKNKKLLYFIPLFLYFFIFLSCNSKYKNKILYKYYENGTIKGKCIILDKNKDPEKESIMLEYDKFGNQIDSFYLKNGKINGIRKIFNLNDSITDIFEYHDDLKNGKVIGYYPDGKLRYKGFCSNDKDSGDFYWYYRNSVISAYKYFSKPDSLIFYRKYDENGKISQTISRSIFRLVLNNIIFKLDDTLKANIFPAFVPNCKINIYSNLAEKSSKSNKFKRINFDGYPFIILHKRLRERGDAEWKFRWELYDTLRNNSYKGFSLIKVKVK